MKISKCILFYTFTVLSTITYASECITQKNDNYYQVKCKNIAAERLQEIYFHHIEYSRNIPAYVDSTNGYSGYDSNDISINYNNYLVVKNNTPRTFYDLAFISDGIAYRLDLYGNNVLPFTEMGININDQLNLSAGKKVFLDPNPTFRPSIANFKKISGDDKELRFFKNYGLLISWMKMIYSDSKTKEEFFDYFMNTRKDSIDTTLSKWYKTNLYDSPKDYYVYKSSTAGAATASWLTINWPMGLFDNDKSYSFIFGTYSHEYAHTMGYSHGSGLAYGWDDFIRKYVDEIVREQYYRIGEPIVERGSVYWHYDINDNKIYPYYVASQSGPNISEVSLIFPRNPNVKILSNSRSIEIKNESNGRVSPILINSSDTSSYITPELNSESPIYLLGVGTKNYSSDTPSGDSSVYFYVPTNQENVITSESSSPNDRKWGAGDGYTKIVINSYNKNDGESHEVILRGNKNFRGYDKKLNEGMQRGYGSAKIIFNKKDNPELPSGSYNIDFYFIGQGWHDTSYNTKIYIKDELYI
ncbi:MAG: hypothetical protein ACI8TE_000992 [Francisella sp.]|jgi:hypothetical protein